MKRFERFCGWSVVALVSCFMLYLAMASIVWTQVFYIFETQTYIDGSMPRLRDGIKENVFLIFVFMVILVLLSITAKKWMKQWQINVVLILEMLLVFVGCCLYNASLKATPWADSAWVVAIARRFLAGDFSSFAQGEYLAMYPHQVGLAWFISGLITVFPQYNIVTVFQVMNCMCVAGTIWGGYYAVHHLWNRKSVDVVYLGITGAFLPSLFYTGYVYGETLSIFLSVLVIGQMICILQEEPGKKSILRFTIVVLGMCLAMLVRKNTLIIIIAICIVSVLLIICEKNKRGWLILLAAVLGVSFPTFHRTVLYGDYYVADYEYPANSWIHIGMLEGSGFGIGAYDGTAYKVFEKNNFDKEATKQDVKRLIRERMQYFLDNPEYMRNFYKEKLLWQWVSPDYECFSYVQYCEEGYPKGMAYEINYGKYREGVFRFMNAYQSFVYLAVVLGGLLLMIKKESFIGHIWSISLLGGLLFSLLWEASPRYVYPYVVMMLPCCAYGIAVFAEVLLEKAKCFGVIA